MNLPDNRLHLIPPVPSYKRDLHAERDTGLIGGGDLIDAISAAADPKLNPFAPVVYFVQAGNDGPIKIGYSKHLAGVQKRVDVLQTGCPWPLVIRRVMQARTGQYTERSLHRDFGRYRMAGEWFAPVEEVAAMAKARPGQLDPLTRTLVAAYDRGFQDGNNCWEDTMRRRTAQDLRELADRLHSSEDDEDHGRWERERLEAIAELMPDAA